MPALHSSVLSRNPRLRDLPSLSERTLKAAARNSGSMIEVRSIQEGEGRLQFPSRDAALSEVSLEGTLFRVLAAVSFCHLLNAMQPFIGHFTDRRPCRTSCHLEWG